jgi:hypothetical protein
VSKVAVKARAVRDELLDPFVGTDDHHCRLRLRILAILCVVAAVDVAVTGAVWIAGGLGEGRSVTALGHALVWTTSQLLTGGSSLSAKTGLSHALEVLLELLAVTAVASLAASVTAFLQQKDSASGDAGAGR